MTRGQRKWACAQSNESLLIIVRLIAFFTKIYWPFRPRGAYNTEPWIRSEFRVHRSQRRILRTSNSCPNLGIGQLGFRKAGCRNYIISYHIISYRNIYHIVPYHIISYHIISYHIVPYHIVPYHIIYHIIPYHIVPYRTTHTTRVQPIHCGLDNLNERRRGRANFRGDAYTVRRWTRNLRTKIRECVSTERIEKRNATFPRLLRDSVK